MILDPTVGSAMVPAEDFSDTAVCAANPPFGGKNGGGDEYAERVFNLKRDYWVPYKTGNAALAHLRALFQHPKTRRAPCWQIVGDANNGKTTIAVQFNREIAKAIPPKPRQTEVPVLFVHAPADGDLNTLFGMMLGELGAPYIEASKASKKYLQVKRILEFSRTRMLIVDEFHNIVECNRTRQKVFLNTLKQFSNELGIPIVLIGTRESHRVIQTDPQLGSRFDSFIVPRWQLNKDYAKFVNHLFSGMGMRAGATLAKKTFIQRIHAMSEGLAGETKGILVKAAENAIRAGKETLDMKALDEIEWTKPSERRKKAEKM